MGLVARGSIGRRRFDQPLLLESSTLYQRASALCNKGGRWQPRALVIVDDSLSLNAIRGSGQAIFSMSFGMNLDAKSSNGAAVRGSIRAVVTDVPQSRQDVFLGMAFGHLPS